MGIFDTTYADLPCDRCGRTAPRQVQFKHRGAFLEVYELGDFCTTVPAGQVALRGGFTCPCGAEETVRVGDRSWTRRGTHYNDCWVHFDNGFLSDVTRDRPEEPRRVDLALHQRRGQRARRWLGALHRISNLCSARRRSITEGPPDEDDPWGRFLAIHHVASEEELLDRIEDTLADALPRTDVEEGATERGDDEGDVEEE